MNKFIILLILVIAACAVEGQSKKKSWICRSGCERLERTKYYICKDCKKSWKSDKKLDSDKDEADNLKMSLPKLSDLNVLGRIRNGIKNMRSKRDVSKANEIDHHELMSSLISLLDDFGLMEKVEQ